MGFEIGCWLGCCVAELSIHEKGGNHLEGNQGNLGNLAKKEASREIWEIREIWKREAREIWEIWKNGGKGNMNFHGELTTPP